MRFWIFSDLHLDANGTCIQPLTGSHPDHEVVIIAGDISTGVVNSIRWIVNQGLNSKPVIYVPGNHEYYGYDRYDELVRGLAEAARSENIHLLHNTSVQISDVLFLGGTLWTDYKLFGTETQKSAQVLAKNKRSDHKLIKNKDCCWSPMNCAAEHYETRNFIGKTLEDESASFKVVVTHHSPSLRSVPRRFQNDLLSAAFASNREAEMKNAELWIHGHTHDAFDYMIGDCRVVTNPKGILAKGEGRAFNPNFAIEI